MLNTRSIGKKIVELRHNANMTQMELADKLFISYQAVSNWERGNSLPDVTKLPELAQLFNITISELLGETNSLIESAVKDEEKEFVKNNPQVTKEFKDALPVLKPNQIDTIIDEIQDKTDLDDLLEILPFLSETKVKNIAQIIFDKEEFNKIYLIAPFMDEGDVFEFVLKLLDRDYSITKLLPFIN
ncbi:helix-turn-helix domain-containing protein, partial [Anaerorhabdus sp.]|uniref:helix-turn-helix domain-containing protein n=1 Tax=Anaerorhabdus sp. TaxID=1872524 RepID=UPI002FC9A7DA